MIWIFHIIIITILLLIAKYMKNDGFFIKSSFVYAVFIFGQRWMTGTDFPHYLKYYLIDFSQVEPGYYLIQKILTEGQLYFGILIFITFFITLYNNYRFISKINHNVVIIIYLFVISEIFFAQMSQIRQFMAVSFFINSYFYAFHKSYFKSFSNIIFGLLFHESILFFVPFLFLRFKLDKVKTLYLLILSGVLPLLDVSILFRLPIFSRYSSYVDSIFNVNLSVFHYVKFYIILLVILIFVWHIEKFGTGKIEQMILNGLVFNFLLYGLSFQFGIVLRASMYFKIFEVVFLAYYFKEVRGFSRIISKSLVVGLFLGIYGGLAVTDPYDISRYDFEPLRIRETRTVDQLNAEIDGFFEE